MSRKSQRIIQCVGLLAGTLLLSACGGGDGGSTTFTITASAASNGAISPTSASVTGSGTVFTLTPDTGYQSQTVTANGCSGTLAGNSYTITSIGANCTLSATFSALPAPTTGANPSFVVPTTESKLFRFSWTDISGATFYQITERDLNATPSNPAVISGNIATGTQQFDYRVPALLHERLGYEYVLNSCTPGGCVSSATTIRTDNFNAQISNAIGYFKAVNNGNGDLFGVSSALSADGSTLVVGAPREDSPSTAITPGTGSSGSDVNSNQNTGAVYVYTRSGNSWAQQAYIKASNADLGIAGAVFTGEVGDQFGTAVSLSDDGNTLAIGAHLEDGNGSGGEADNSAADAGAVYIFQRTNGVWAQQAYLKAGNAEANDLFGFSISLSADGDILAVGAFGEDGNDRNTPSNNGAAESGAVYLFTRSGVNWTQQNYVKPAVIGTGDEFGGTISISGDGTRLAVGAEQEDSSSGGNTADNGATNSGAVYIFLRSGAVWNQEAYLKASNIGGGSNPASTATDGDRFGSSLSLDSDGNTLAVGAALEDASGISILAGTNPTIPADGSEGENHGAAYVFGRTGTSWAQQAYIKAGATTAGDLFGAPLNLSADGNKLAVGAVGEDSNFTGVASAAGGAAAVNNSSGNSGAVTVFSRSSGTWTQSGYIKSSNAEASDIFVTLGLSSDGNTLAVGARLEDSNATAINGSQVDNSNTDSGAVYLY